MTDELEEITNEEIEETEEVFDEREDEDVK